MKQLRIKQEESEIIKKQTNLSLRNTQKLWICGKQKAHMTGARDGDENKKTKSSREVHSQVPKWLEFSTLVEDWRFFQFSLEHIRLIRK